MMPAASTSLVVEKHVAPTHLRVAAHICSQASSAVGHTFEDIAALWSVRTGRWLLSSASMDRSWKLWDRVRGDTFF